MPRRHHIENLDLANNTVSKRHESLHKATEEAVKAFGLPIAPLQAINLHRRVEDPGAQLVKQVIGLQNCCL